MCGIVVTTRNVNKGTIAKAVAHRGTLPPAFATVPGALFCHTLMPVQGGTPTAQPYTGRAGVLCFQGELWEHKGYKSDTEYLYHTLAAGCNARTVAGLNGMFAFVYHRGRTIFFAVDIFGEQPLYYAHTGNGFFGGLTVASELKQLRVAGEAYQNIRPCVPGVLYTYDTDSGNLKEEVYHTFDYGMARAATWDAEELRGKVAESVREKYTANHLQKPALLLSGGVDSAVLAYELSKLGLRDAYTVGTDKDSPDFTRGAATAARFGLRHKKVLCKTFNIDTSLAFAETRNRCMVEENICHLALARCLADDGYRVVFGGNGADELFCGYAFYLRFHGAQDMQKDFIENYYRMDLRVANKVYMSNAIEIRNPFLTKRLANYCLGLDVAACLIGPKHEMKLALRESYKDIIPTAGNKKVPAPESMGVKAYFEKVYGAKNPRAYHERYKTIFTNNAVLEACVRGIQDVKYEVLK